jgi:prolyl oligopeptidase
VRHVTTTALTPREVHEIGLNEVARIRAEMESIRKQVGFDGDLAAFFEHLRTDPKFYYDSPEALFEAYLAASKRVDPELVKLFGRLPRMPYGVRPIPEAIAPDTTTAYYSRPAADGSRAGYYYVNLYRPEVRPKYEIEALTIHEAVPGHHLQIALAQELEGRHPWRALRGDTAFVEGWALYAERLGLEMSGGDRGFYEDPYDDFGRLSYEMWRALRLVVDTGIHAQDWSRERAVKYMLDNSALTELNVRREVDRYVAWPGQATAYKIGELEIRRIRAHAEKTLGDRFDLRAFHDALLANGPLPLGVLRLEMTRWIETMAAAK